MATKTIDCLCKTDEYRILKSVAAVSPSVESVSLKCAPFTSLSASTRKHFEAANTRFVNRSTKKAPPQFESEVCRSPTGDICVATSRLTAKFDGRKTFETINNMVTRHGLRLGRPLTFSTNTYDIRVPAGMSSFDAANKLAEESTCIYAVPELLQEYGERFIPNDPRYDNQWQWSALNTEQAWNTTKGAGARIAIIDFGYHLGNSDLAGAFTRTGYFQEMGPHHSASFFADSSLVPRHSHGTFCAGMAGARGDNSAFGCGVAFESELILIAVSPVMTQQTLARAIAYAANPTTTLSNTPSHTAADVISISIAPPFHAISPILNDAIEAATLHGRGGLGIPIFYAVSNSSTAISHDPLANHPNTIAVGRSNRSDRRSPCAFGDALEFVAPGQLVHSINSSSGFSTRSGTSFATPCAAGVAALMISTNPSLSESQIRTVMRDSCDKIGGDSVTYDADGRNVFYGHGRLNAAQAVSMS